MAPLDFMVPIVDETRPIRLQRSYVTEQHQVAFSSRLVIAHCLCPWVVALL
jgi:hypothetical protein